MSGETKSLYKYKDKLPILQDFMPTSNAQVIPFEEGKDGKWQWRKGEKGANNIIQYGILGALGYGLYLILPALLVFAQNLLYLGLMVLALLALLAFIPVFKRGLRLAVRKAHEAIIEHDPIANLRMYLEEYKQKKEQFKYAKAQIKKQHQILSNEAFNKQDEATGAKQYLERIQEAVKNLSPDDKTGRIRLAGEFENWKMKFTSSKDLAEKYAVQAKQIEKAINALDLAQVHLGNRIERLKITIDSAEQRLKFANAASTAAALAADILTPEEKWEIEHALVYIEDSIQGDLALFSENMNVIVNNVGSQNMNVNTILQSVDNLNLDIRSVDGILDSKYELTGRDQSKSGIDVSAVDDLFN